MLTTDIPFNSALAQAKAEALDTLLSLLRACQDPTERRLLASAIMRSSPISSTTTRPRAASPQHTVEPEPELPTDDDADVNPELSKAIETALTTAINSAMDTELDEEAKRRGLNESERVILQRLQAVRSILQTHIPVQVRQAGSPLPPRHSDQPPRTTAAPPESVAPLASPETTQSPEPTARSIPDSTTPAAALLARSGALEPDHAGPKTAVPSGLPPNIPFAAHSDLVQRPQFPFQVPQKRVG